jgi:hypothetical protein
MHILLSGKISFLKKEAGIFLAWIRPQHRLTVHPVSL